MSNNCLVTKLKESVNNDSLHRIGEMFFKTYHADEATADSNYLPIFTTGAITVRVVSGDGYLTDDDLVSNPVKQKTFSSGNLNIYFSNHDMVIGITPKYSFFRIGIGSYTAQHANWGFDLSELEYANLDDLVLSRYHITGDVSHLSNCLNTDTTTGNYFDLWSYRENVHITGNINALDGLFTNCRFFRLSLTDQNVYGDIVSFVNSNINQPLLTNTSQFGEITWAKNVPVSGDLSKFDSGVFFFDSTGNTNEFSWKT